MAIRITPVLLAPLCFCVNASFIATAATIPVTSLADDGPGTLRDAIVHAANGDTIVFSVTGRIVLKTGELRVTTNVRILGPGPGNLSVDGNSESRVFHITPVTDVLISGLTITNGLHRGDTLDGGGGILNQYASLTVSNCVLAGNSAYFSGGGIYNNTELGGHLVVVSSLFTGNSASRGGALVSCGPGGETSVEIRNSAFIQNAALQEHGGAILNLGCGKGSGMTIETSVVSSNIAVIGGGLVNINGTMILSNTTVANNQATDTAGGVGNYSFYYLQSAHLKIFNSTISGNSAQSIGGIDNWCYFGRSEASIQINRSTLSGNSANSGAGAISSHAELSSYPPSARVNVTILNSTLSGNSATNPAALYNIGPGISNAVLEIGSSILDSGPGRNIESDFGLVVSDGFNLSTDSGYLTKTTDQNNTDPKLGPLQDNGGPTFTHGFLCVSPGIDRGKLFSGSSTDQRGFPGTFDDLAVENAAGSDATDVGAFEEQTPLRICNRPPIADAEATLSLVISPNGSNATVILDGSRSQDPDGDILQYTWYNAGMTTPLTTGVVSVAVLPVGTNVVSLVVNDGTLSDKNSVFVEVITAAQAVQRLLDVVSSNLPRSSALQATLKASLASINKQNFTSATHQMRAFQNQVRAQILTADPTIGEALNKAAQAIIDALAGS